MWIKMFIIKRNLLNKFNLFVKDYYYYLLEVHLKWVSNFLGESQRMMIISAALKTGFLQLIGANLSSVRLL